jgi:phage terminase small subunit
MGADNRLGRRQPHVEEDESFLRRFVIPEEDRASLTTAPWNRVTWPVLRSTEEPTTVIVIPAGENEGPMTTLSNPRHERFAQELAAGKTADAAYVLAGYRANRSNAARLNANQDIQKRVAEIQSVGAERAAVTVETLIAEAEEARSKAMGEKGGAAAAVAAITAKAKLAGLWRDKVAVTDPSGEGAPRYIISDHPMTEEEWARERCR